MPIAQPAEVQAVKDAPAKDPNDIGVGILHLPADKIVLAPFDSVGGHDALVLRENFLPVDCRGFVIVLSSGAFDVINSSHLNGTQGQTGSLQMPQSLFATIESELRRAGL